MGNASWDISTSLSCKHSFNAFSLPAPCPTLLAHRLPSFYSPHAHPQLATMSDKMKELIEIPQDFIRDGNQVRLVSINLLVKELMHTLVHSSSHGVPSLRKRVSIYMSCAVSPRRYSIGIPRVLADLQGCRHRLRCYGIHRVLREAHPYPNVRITTPQ